MMRLLSSLHFTRWLRVVAVAGVVLASTATAYKDPTQSSYSTSSSSARTANGWCPRC